MTKTIAAYVLEVVANTLTNNQSTRKQFFPFENAFYRDGILTDMQTKAFPVCVL